MYPQAEQLPSASLNQRVLPADPANERSSLAHWRQYQRRVPTTAEVAGWFANRAALDIVTGAISGQPEILDFCGGGELFSSAPAIFPH